jgi:hypothetical protein
MEAVVLHIPLAFHKDQVMVLKDMFFHLGLNKKDPTQGMVHLLMHPVGYLQVLILEAMLVPPFYFRV